MEGAEPMAKCEYCGSMIIMGGVKEGNFRFCNEECHRKGFLTQVGQAISPAIVQDLVQKVHMGLCPKCQGAGPVDVHTSHLVWSAVIMTVWSSKPLICCRSCGIKAQAKNMILSAMLGWWGFPWGVIATPIQIVRNIAGMIKSPDPSTPSPQLEKMLRITLATQAMVPQLQEGKKTK